MTLQLHCVALLLCVVALCSAVSIKSASVKTNDPAKKLCLKAGSELSAGYKTGNPQGSDDKGRARPGGSAYCATDCEGKCIKVRGLC